MPLPLSPAGRRYGYLPPKPDHRDFSVSRLALPQATSPFADNSKFMGPVLNQGAQGSCTAHAGVADREFLHWKTLGELRHEEVKPDSVGLFSPSFLYYLERQLDGSLSEGDCGSTGRTSCQVLRNYGCALRETMPYLDSDFTTAPSQAQLSAALQWPTGGYHQAKNVEDMKSILASGYNVRVGFTVFESFESDWSVKGYMPVPAKSERQLGGHEILFIGYEDAKSAFLARNSWGSDWGLNGNFYFPYSAAADGEILMDGWVQHLGEWGSKK